MKIGIDARLWNETGVGRYIRNLVIQLGKLDTKNTYVLFVRKEDYSQIKAITPQSWKLVSVSIQWHSLKEQFSFLPVLYKEQLDLMHFPYFSLPVLYGRPFVVTIHDLIIHSFATGKASTLPLPLYKMKHFAYKRVIEQATKRAEKVIVPLNAVKKEIEETLHLSAEKVAVTYEGFDGMITNSNDLKSTDLPVKEHAYFLYVGNSYPHKNVEKLLEGFLQFQKNPEYADYSLVLVGKEDYFSKRIKRNVKHVRNVSDSELGYLYNHAIALVSASLMEGFGLPCLEAAACECLVAVSDIPSFREVCGENALYFSPSSSESIASIFPKILSLHPEKKKAFISGGKKKAQTFSWMKMTQETIKIYESCISVRSSK
jgi:glycosyltransferase involved in cell wall biosynthesis